MRVLLYLNLFLLEHGTLCAYLASCFLPSDHYIDLVLLRASSDDIHLRVLFYDLQLSLALFSTTLTNLAYLTLPTLKLQA